MRFIAGLFAFATLLVAPAAAQVIDPAVKSRAPIPSATDKQNLLLLDLSTGGRVTIWLRPDLRFTA